jgi:hypothetical protein
MKQLYLIEGTCYYRREGSRKPTTGAYTVTVEVNVPEGQGVVQFIQNHFIQPYLKANPPFPGFIGWQTCLATPIGTTADVDDVDPLFNPAPSKKKKKIV